MSEQTEQQLSDAIESALAASGYLERYREMLATHPVNFVYVQLPILAPYLISRSVKRQEQIAAALLQESKTLTRLTWAIVILTGFVAVLTAAVCYLTVLLLKHGR